MSAGVGVEADLHGFGKGTKTMGGGVRLVKKTEK